jgi:hypothetical protein
MFPVYAVGWMVVCPIEALRGVQTCKLFASSM